MITIKIMGEQLTLYSFLTIFKITDMTGTRQEISKSPDFLADLELREKEESCAYKMYSSPAILPSAREISSSVQMTILYRLLAGLLRPPQTALLAWITGLAPCSDLSREAFARAVRFPHRNIGCGLLINEGNFALGRYKVRADLFSGYSTSNL